MPKNLSPRKLSYPRRIMQTSSFSFKRTLLPDEAKKVGLIDFEDIDIDMKFIASFEPLRRQIFRIVDIGHRSSANCLFHILDPVNDLGQRVGALAG